MEHKGNNCSLWACRLLLIVFIIVIFAAAWMLPTAPCGESSSFMLSTVSLSHGRLNITESDLQEAVTLFPGHKTILDWYYHSFLPVSENGNHYPWYFGAYSFLCLPLFLLFKVLGWNAVYAFPFTNALVFAAALFVTYRCCKISGWQKFSLLLLLSFSPIVPYIKWQSYEMMTAAFVILAMTFWSNDDRKRAALFLSIAGTMNPTAMGFGFFMILDFFAEIAENADWKATSFFHSCTRKWKEILLFALCFVPCLIPFIITYRYFGTYNMVAMLGVATNSGIISRFCTYLFDLNMGIFPYYPVLLLTFFVICIKGIARKQHKAFNTFWGVLFTILAYSITVHINCGMSGMARYNAWMVPMMLFPVVRYGGVDFKTKRAKNRWLRTLMCSAAWAALTVAIVGMTLYTSWTPYAKLALEYVPGLYNPMPATFHSRTDHVDGGYNYDEPVYYINDDGYVRKVWIPEGATERIEEGLWAEDQYDSGQLQNKLEKAYQKNGNCYLNFPHRMQIKKNGEFYSIGDEILFTEEDNGTRYFTKGISLIETNFAWSDGKTGKLVFSLGAVEEDLVFHADFACVFGGSQAVSFSSCGKQLYNGQVTADVPSIEFTVPKECVKSGQLELIIEYPDSVDLAKELASEDNRIIAVGYSRIQILPVSMAKDAALLVDSTQMAA